MKKLKIYKASAGSGKTYSLTNEYIRLIMTGKDVYSHILAVTFTNKATEEMKRRIVQELYRRSENDVSSRDLLIRILHDYSHFSISTIDRFFQQTMRSFAREIGKNSSYGIELDESEILLEAIDNMLYSLDKEESRELLQWLLSFYMNNLESGEGWSRKRQIFALSKELFKEQFRKEKQLLFQKIADKQLLTDIKDSIITCKRELESKLENFGLKGVELMQRYGLAPEEMSGGSRSPFFIFKEWSSGSKRTPTATFLKLYDNCDKWYSKETLKKNPCKVCDIEQLYAGGMNSLIEEVILFEEEGRVLYNTICAILDNLYLLGILSDVDLFVKKYSQENNVVLLSDTTELLNRIIDGSDTPFVYEKIGSRIDHFMLDEFQDTSVMQWENIRPLVQNSLAAGKENLIVGDVKQSIYRWRGSDWTLLEKTIYNDFRQELVETCSLSENWRSSTKIIEFNNKFFVYAAAAIDTFCSSSGLSENSLISSVYREVTQRVSDLRAVEEGFISVDFISDYDLLEEFDQKALELLRTKLDDLINRGFALDDISILVRKNNEGSAVANYLIRNGYRVLSDESLLISSSQTVRKIIALLSYYQDTTNSVRRLSVEMLGIDPEEINEPLTINEYSLYELCEQIIMHSIGAIDSSESVFVTAFLDLVLEFSGRESSDITHFLEWWNKKGVLKSISAPDNQNAIRIMTIHKAKGLGLNVVILPFFREPFEKNNRGILWCKTDGLVAPISELPVLPLKITRELNSTLFAPQYQEERLRNYIDILNVSYVAFTRAKQELHIIAPVPKSNKEMTGSLSEILYKHLGSALSYSSGKAVKKESYCELISSSTEIPLPDFISSYIDNRLTLSLHSSDYLDEASRRSYGLIMHKILSRVYSEADLEQSVYMAISDGEIKEREADLIYKTLHGYLLSVRDYGWFSSVLEVFNEAEIICAKGEIFRPDRILINRSENSATVIDFKFGLKKNPKYKTQIRNYMTLILEIGLVSVRGFVWYPEIGEIEEIK